MTYAMWHECLWNVSLLERDLVLSFFVFLLFTLLTRLIIPYAFRIWNGQSCRFIGLESVNGMACGVNHCAR